MLETTPADRRDLPDVDPLTGVLDRAGFDLQLAALWSALGRRHLRMSLLMIDVDHFARYNDAYGQPAGDDCLRTLAGCLRRAVPAPPHVPARCHGAEFAVILPEASSRTARQVAERIRACVAAAAVPHSRSPHGRVTLSIGAATRCPDPLPNAHLLVADADVALHAAKAAGRDRVVGVDGGVLCA